MMGVGFSRHECDWLTQTSCTTGCDVISKMPYTARGPGSGSMVSFDLLFNYTFLTVDLWLWSLLYRFGRPGEFYEADDI
jgi:hypothetical protein